MSAADKALERVTKHALHNAFALARMGVHVFPVGLADPRPEGDGYKFTKVYYKGLLWSQVATTDPEAIATMFGEYPGSAVGISTGPSKLVVLDRDDLDVILPEVPDGFFGYVTMRGGIHQYFRAPKKHLVKSGGTPRRDATDESIEYPSTDVKASGGMVVYYGPKLKGGELDNLPESPAWLNLPAGTKGEPSAAGMTLSRWIEACKPGEPGPKAMAEVKRISRHDTDDETALDVTNNLAKLASGGAPGIPLALAKARRRYLRDWPDPKHVARWDGFVAGAITFWPAPSDLGAAALADPYGIEYPAPFADEPADVVERALEILPPVATRPFEKAKRIKPLPRSTPDDFFDLKTGVLAERLGAYVGHARDIGYGLDGRLWRHEGGVWSPDEDIVRERVVRLLRDRYRPGTTAVAEDMVKFNLDTPIITGLPHPAFINCLNGMLDWRTGELHPHDPRYLSTVQLDVSYTPGAAHPLFDRWLALVCADDPELAVTLWEIIAYTVYNGNPFQKAAMLHGVANGGKSTFIELLERIAGESNVAHLTPEQMEERFGAAALHGKLLNTQGEYEGKRLQSTNHFKSIISGDKISTEHKNKPAFTFRPWAFHAFAGNEFDLTSDTTEGYYRRWLVVNFTREVRSVIDWGLEEFLAEADAIFSSAITRLPALLAAKKFTETLHTMTTQATMRRESDTAATWLHEDEHVVEHDPSNRDALTPRTHVYTVYKTWCEREGIKYALTGPALYKRLYRLGFEVKVIKGIRYMIGLRVDTLPLNVRFEEQSK